jgi:hypothetical protein
VKTIEELRRDFASKQQAATIAALAYHNAATSDPSADPLARPLLSQQDTTALVEKGMASIQTTDWLKIAGDVLGAVVKLVV